MEKIRLIGRNSRLSMLQMNLVKNKIETRFPETEVEIITKTSLGDRLPEIPLQTVEGVDFFTQDIFNSLLNKEADIAVHSLKDMSATHFFGENNFAVVDREYQHDCAIFNPSIIEKLKQGKEIVVGTCSPRREEMAIKFLQQALPFYGKTVQIITKSIRGNIDTRLQKLDQRQYDAIILAAAGINRLLKSKTDAPLIRALLLHKKIMLLPLIECVPAPCQGAIVTEATKNHPTALAILSAIKEEKIHQDCINEKKFASQYGVGCLQKFGVTTLPIHPSNMVYAAGKKSDDTDFTNWFNLPILMVPAEELFSSTDYMSRFFNYTYSEQPTHFSTPTIFIANYKAVHLTADINSLQQKRIWVSGTKTWLALAKLGIWVEGSADAFGLDSLLPLWESPLLNIKKEDTTILTNKASEKNWQSKFWNTASSYELANQTDAVVTEKIKAANYIFWTSYRQYEQYKNQVKPNAQHLCCSGETATLLRAKEIQPIVFPNIKAFQQWRITNTF
ncbi:MAG: hydroxymethylbilane synthase [Sphingobacteriia bacterium]|nr:MAG: hydroxymethylbilane synthase [Sphingobacteriia bacterium]